MSDEELLKTIQEKFKDAVRIENKGNLAVSVNKNEILSLITFLSGEPLLFDWMNFMTAVDKMESGTMELVYQFYSFSNKTKLTVKTEVSRDLGVVDSVCGIYPTAEWHEREVYDLFGIIFKDHPDLRRIMMPDGFTGHPMRKDYKDENLVRLESPWQ